MGYVFDMNTGEGITYVDTGALWVKLELVLFDRMVVLEWELLLVHK